MTPLLTLVVLLAFQETPQLSPASLNKMTLEELRRNAVSAEETRKVDFQLEILKRSEAPVQERSAIASRLIERYSVSGEPAILGPALAAQGSTLGQSGDLQKAVAVLKEAEQVLEAISDSVPSTYFNAVCNRAAFLMALGHRDESAKVIRKAIDFSSRHADLLTAPYAYIILAHLAESAGAVTQSLEYLKTAFELAVRMDNASMAGIAGETIVSLLSAESQYHEAETWVRRAEPWILRTPDPAVRRSFAMRKDELLTESDPDRAAENLRSLLHNPDNQVDPQFLGLVSMALATAELRRRNPDAALEAADSAVSHLKEFQRSLSLSRHLRLRALFELRRYDEVLKGTEELIAEGPETSLAVLRSLELRSEAQEKLGQFDQALATLHEFRAAESRRQKDLAAEQARFIAAAFLDQDREAELKRSEHDRRVAESEAELNRLKAEKEAATAGRAILFRNATIAVCGLMIAAVFTGLRLQSRQKAERLLARQAQELNQLLREQLRLQAEELQQEVIARQSLESAIEQKRRDEAIGKLTGGVAHDFNNLLTVILQSNELAASLGDPLPESVQEMLAASTKAAESGASIVRELLAYARQQPLAPARIRTSEWLSDVRSLFLRTAGRNVAWTDCDDSRNSVICVDAGRLTTAIINLIANARDAVTEAGRIDFRITRMDPSDAQTADWPGLNRGNYVLFQVSDNGRGMTSELLARACEPFVTSKASGEGTGLGLSSVLGFARQSGGDLRLVSAPGQGTTAFLAVPVDHSESPSDSGKVSVLPKTVQRVLLVEDQEPVRFVLSTRLQTMGLLVTEAENAEQAMEVFRKRDSLPDVVLTDVRMPGAMDGIALRRWILARYPDMPVILMSGYNECRQDPGSVVLHKPLRNQDLEQIFRSAS